MRHFHSILSFLWPQQKHIWWKVDRSSTVGSLSWTLVLWLITCLRWILARLVKAAKTLLEESKKKKTSQICLSNPVLPCDIMRDSRALYGYPSGSVSSNETENLSVDNCTNPVLLLFSIVICFHSPLKLRPPFTLSVSLITCCKFPFFSFFHFVLFWQD